MWKTPSPMPHSPTKAVTKLSDAIDRYLVYLQAEENKSPLTIATYRLSLNSLIELSGITDPLLISKGSIRVYKSALHSYRTN